MIARIFRRTWWDRNGNPEAGRKHYVQTLTSNECESHEELNQRAREECARRQLPPECLRENRPTEANPRGRSWKFEFETEAE